LKKLLAFIISLTLIISALALLGERPSDLAAFAGIGGEFKPVNIVQFFRQLLK